MKRYAIVTALIFLFLIGCAAQKKAVPPTAEGVKPAPSGPTEEEKARELARLREMELAKKRKVEAEAKEFEKRDIHFDFDKYNLKPEARAILKELGHFLLEHPEYKLTIEGHCDERGTNEYNLALGEKRAHAAKEYLVAMGVSADRITTISYGEERPLCFEHNEGCWWRNRRDHFLLTK